MSNDFITAESRQALALAASQHLFAVTLLHLFPPPAPTPPFPAHSPPLCPSANLNDLSFLDSPPPKCHPLFPPPPPPFMYFFPSLMPQSQIVPPPPPLLPPCPNPSFSPSTLIRSRLPLICLQISSLPPLPSLPPSVSL